MARVLAHFCKEVYKMVLNNTLASAVWVRIEISGTTQREDLEFFISFMISYIFEKMYLKIIKLCICAQNILS